MYPNEQLINPYIDNKVVIINIVHVSPMSFLINAYLLFFTYFKVAKLIIY